jgi:tetratricopeptide (TPR) repeat protein
VALLCARGGGGAAGAPAGDPGTGLVRAGVAADLQHPAGAAVAQRDRGIELGPNLLDRGQDALAPRFVHDLADEVRAGERFAREVGPGQLDEHLLGPGADQRGSCGDNEAALRAYAEAIRLDPRSSFALNSRGLTYVLLKSYDLAIADFDKAIAYVDAGYARIGAKKQAPQRRKGVRDNYDHLFVAIGRRDGFECAQCTKSGNDLQIDHINPVSNGGGNNLDNLQLLCRGCNARKSDSIVQGATR